MDKRNIVCFLMVVFILILLPKFIYAETTLLFEYTGTEKTHYTTIKTENFNFEGDLTIYVEAGSDNVDIANTRIRTTTNDYCYVRISNGEDGAHVFATFSKDTYSWFSGEIKVKDTPLVTGDKAWMEYDSNTGNVYVYFNSPENLIAQGFNERYKNVKFKRVDCWLRNSGENAATATYKLFQGINYVPPTFSHITVLYPEEVTSTKPENIVFKINSWHENKGLILTQRHIDGTEYVLHQMNPMQVDLYKNGSEISVPTRDVKPGVTRYMFHEVHESGLLGQLIHVHESDYTADGISQDGVYAEAKIKFVRDIESNADTSKIYLLYTEYLAKYKLTGKAVPGELRIQTVSTYNGQQRTEEKIFKYPTSNILTKWYYGLVGMPEASYRWFSQRVYCDTDSQHNLLNPIDVRIRFYPEGKSNYIQHVFQIPAAYNPHNEGRDKFITRPVDTDNTPSTPEGNWEIPIEDQNREGFTPIQGISEHVDEATQRMLDKLALGPLQQTFAKLAEMNTASGQAPKFTVNLNSFVAAGKNIHGKETGNMPAEATLIDFQILENYSYAGFNMIDLIRALITFGMIYMTVMYIWRKVEDVSAS